LPECLALVGFVILVTPEPSIIRASIMAAIVLAFIASARPVRGIPVLGVTVLILLAINPWMALDFAFALSVMATGGILLFSVPLAKKFGRFLPAPLALILALPVAAQIACQPILILLNPVIPVLAVPANALAAPAAPLATIIGMVACVFAGVLPDLSASLVGLAWWPSAYIAAIGRSLSAAPFATLPWPTGWGGSALQRCAWLPRIGLVSAEAGKTSENPQRHGYGLERGGPGDDDGVSCPAGTGEGERPERLDHCPM
jgi:competence protein ComEC